MEVSLFIDKLKEQVNISYIMQSKNVIVQQFILISLQKILRQQFLDFFVVTRSNVSILQK